MDCAANFDVRCGCAGEVWMNADCSQAFVCDAEIDADNVNDGHLAECPNGIIDIDWNTPFAFGCSTEKACPGSFHFGCTGGNVPNPPGGEDAATGVRVAAGLLVATVLVLAWLS